MAEESAAGLSRRGLLGLAGGAGAAGIALGAAGMWGLTRSTEAAASDVVPYSGAHQAGISTRGQDHLHFAAFDVSPSASRADVQSLLEDWSYAIARMTQGLDVSASGALGGGPDVPPDDTGEALGLGARALTVTVGVGPSLFDDRFGLASTRPEALAPLPPFLGDNLDPAASDGDLCVQVCADDPQVAFHAVRNLTRIGIGRVRIRWSQLGFGRTSRTTTETETPRNLFGFKDGTANILGDDHAALDEHVWVGSDDGPAWMTGGSYLVVRKISMLIETWDRVRLNEQERIIGRNKGEGAPLSGGTEFTEPDFAKPALDADSHVRLAHPELNDGIRILRRGYNYVDGNNDLGRLDAGLFFLSYQRSPQQFITLQKSLSSDLMLEYITHVGSAQFAILPGAAEGESLGAQLFSAAD